MPALSPTMTQGNIGVWRKSVGDVIAPGDVLVEIETDKAQMDFECQEDGYLAKVLVETGAKDVEINMPIAVMVEDKADVAQFADFTVDAALVASEPLVVKQEVVKEAASPAVVSAPSSDRIVASPLAKSLAKSLGIDLATVKGSGPGGRIVERDLSKAPAAPPAPPVAAAPAPPKTTASPPPPAVGASYTDIPLTNMRKVIAQRLTDSKQQLPHFYLTMQVNMDNILKVRQALNEGRSPTDKISINDFIVKACAVAMKAVPEVNSAWHGEFIRRYNNVDISIATATPTGLITPIIANVESKGVSSIAAQVKELAARARRNELKPHEYQGGTFTISNMGMYGIDQFTAIINPPQSCILAVGSSKQTMVPEGDTFKVIQAMKVTLSCDHRVVDGAVGAQWLNAWKDIMENPLKLLL